LPLVARDFTRQAQARQRLPEHAHLLKDEGDSTVALQRVRRRLEPVDRSRAAKRPKQGGRLTDSPCSEVGLDGVVCHPGRRERGEERVETADRSLDEVPVFTFRQPEPGHRLVTWLEDEL